MAAATQPLSENTKRQVPVSLGGERTQKHAVAPEESNWAVRCSAEHRLISVHAQQVSSSEVQQRPPVASREHTSWCPISPNTLQTEIPAMLAALQAENSPTKQRFLNFSAKINLVQLPEATHTNAEQFKIQISNHQPKLHHAQTTLPFKQYKIKLAAHTSMWAALFPHTSCTAK